jgi:hypothetical protein
MSSVKQSHSPNVRNVKNKAKGDKSKHSDLALKNRINDLHGKISKGKKHEIRISFDSIAKSDSKAFGILLSSLKQYKVLQLWTDNVKMDQIFKQKVIKATREFESPLGPDKKSAQNTISTDTNENIFVLKGVKSMLSNSRCLRLLHFVNLKLSPEGWQNLADGISNNSTLYKIAINQ